MCSRVRAQRRFVGEAAALAPDGAASVAPHPGWVRTEGVMQFAEHLDLVESQSPEGAVVRWPRWQPTTN
jgi:hypothetical protein